MKTDIMELKKGWRGGNRRTVGVGYLAIEGQTG